MMSSDSDDDFCGDAVKRLQKIRQQYFGEHFKKLECLNDVIKSDIEINSDSTNVITPSETNNDLEDSFTIDELLEKHSKIKNRRRGIKRNNPSENEFHEVPLAPIDNGIKQDAKKGCRRSTRLSNIATKIDYTDLLVLDNSPQITKTKTTKSKQRRKNQTNGGSSQSTLTSSFGSCNRRRGRGRRNVKRGQITPYQSIPIDYYEEYLDNSKNIPLFNAKTNEVVDLFDLDNEELPINQSEEYDTIPIGNCEEYPDNSEDTPLFNEKTDEVVDLFHDLDNEELSVKVLWKNSEVCRFNIRKYQKLKQIFEHFSKKENVRQEQLLFTYNDSIIHSDDSPDSIGYNIAKFIDGGYLDHSIKTSGYADQSNLKGIKLKFLFKNRRKPYELTVEPDDRLSLVFLKCAEHIESPLNKLRFIFDGDCISGMKTARELEFEGGECIDVKIIE